MPTEPEPVVYAEGHVKRDIESGAVAIRTIFPEDEPALAGQAWLVATVNRGAQFARTVEVEGWDDVFTPPSAPPPGGGV